MGLRRSVSSLRSSREIQYENLKYSASFTDSMDDRIGIVSNNFHIYRSLMLGRQIGYTRLYGIAAGCNPVLFLNYMVREFLRSDADVPYKRIERYVENTT